MGNLRDELGKLFGKVERKQTSVAQPAKPPAEPARERVEDLPQQNWKAGVTPLDPSHAKKVSKSESAGKSVKPSVRGKLRLPWGRREERTDAPPVRPSPAAPVTERLRPEKAPAEPHITPRQVPNKLPAPARQERPAPGFGTFRPPSLARDREFKAPDAWVSAGAALQPPNSSGGRVLPVRIGIDFGSAYTKAALRAADRVFFLSWDGARDSTVRYFLPGEIATTRDGATWLGRAPGADEIRSDLKLPFVTHAACTREQQAAAVAFLAWVMRYARAWLYHSQGALLRDRSLAWQVNLGCPTNSWSTQHIKALYKEIGLRAWQLSQAPDDITWDGALATRPTDTVDIGLDSLSLMPEFIAQLAGYVRSPQRRNGLHFLMDVGAGTVDVATFNVVYDEKREEDRYPIFASEVKPLGTHFLMESRLSRLGLLRGAWDDLQAVPDAAEVARQLKVDHSRVREIDEEFIARVTSALKRILDYTHQRRYGKAPEWREGLPAFLSGGGSDCEIYSRSLALAFARHGVPLKRTTFPLLQEAEGAGEDSFHRLSVAYGLTFDAESIGRILSPHEIDDAPRFDPVVDRPTRERPDRDELYPK